MSRHSLSNIYGYGFLIKEKKIANNPELFTEELNAWIEANESDPSDEYIEIKDEVDYDNRTISVSDLVGYSEELLSVIDAYLTKNFPLLRATSRILNSKGEETKFFICINSTHVYLEFQKIKEAKKPTLEEKIQLEEFHKLVGAKKKSDWLNVSYIDYP